MAENKRKIIYLVTQSEWGGAQEYVYNLATNLDKNQDQPLVLAGRQALSDQGESKGGNGPLRSGARLAARQESEASGLFSALESQNIPFRQLKWAKRSINPLFDLLSLFELIFVFKKEKPDVIHLNSSKIGFLGSLAAQIYKKIKAARIIYTAHGWVFNEPLPYLIKKFYFWIEKISASWKDAIICVSEADRQMALAHNFKSEIVTIHNAVNPANLDFFDKELAKKKLHEIITENQKSIYPPKLEERKERKTIDQIFKYSNIQIILTIANLYPAKGLNYLIVAAAQLVKANPDLIFMVMGEGQERKNLESLILNHHLENNFFLLGSIPQAHQYLKACDLFVLPSVKEGLPYALLKAISAQIPLVATKVGALPEIIPGELLAEPGSADDLTEKINDAMNNPGKYQIKPNGDFNEFFKQTMDYYTRSVISVEMTDSKLTRF